MPGPPVWFGMPAWSGGRGQGPEDARRGEGMGWGGKGEWGLWAVWVFWFGRHLGVWQLEVFLWQK